MSREERTCKTIGGNYVLFVALLFNEETVPILVEYVS